MCGCVWVCVGVSVCVCVCVCVCVGGWPLLLPVMLVGGPGISGWSRVLYPLDSSQPLASNQDW